MQSLNPWQLAQFDQQVLQPHCGSTQQPWFQNDPQKGQMQLQARPPGKTHRQTFLLTLLSFQKDPTRNFSPTRRPNLEFHHAKPQLHLARPLPGDAHKHAENQLLKLPEGMQV